MSVLDVVFGVVMVVGAASVVAGIGIVVTAKVPRPEWLFGRTEPDDTAKARLIGWHCILQGMLPAVVGALAQIDGLDHLAQFAIPVLLIGSALGTYLVNRRLGVRP